MKKIATALELKRKKFSLRLKLYRHRVIYWVDQNTDEVMFWCFMAGLFASQVMLFVTGR